MVVKEYKPRELNDGVWHRVSGNTDTMDELMRRAKDGDLDILENADVDKVYGITKITPLHMLARVVDGNELIKYIVEHPSVDKVATEKGITPLHI
jgi:ankyrin repeat protein